MAGSASGFIFTNHCVESARFDDGAAAVASSDGVRVIGYFLEQAACFEVRDDALARFEAVEARVRSGRRAHLRVVGHHVDFRQVVAAARSRSRWDRAPA